jgi:hypothetical protein
MSAVIERDRSLAGYPSLSAAAVMIGVATSTVSRRGDLDVTDRGARDRVLAAAEVLRLAAIYRKRSLNEVAGALIAYAEQRAPQEAERIEREVEAFFADRSSDAPQRRSTELLDELRAHLPSELYVEVERQMLKGAGRKPAAVIGEVATPAARTAASRGSRSRSGLQRRPARTASTTPRTTPERPRKGKSARSGGTTRQPAGLATSSAARGSSRRRSGSAVSSAEGDD